MTHEYPGYKDVLNKISPGHNFPFVFAYIMSLCGQKLQLEFIWVMGEDAIGMFIFILASEDVI